MVVAYDEEGRGLSRASLLLPRKLFTEGRTPKAITVVVEWEEEPTAETGK